jgi:hypothetical protein
VSAPWEAIAKYLNQKNQINQKTKTSGRFSGLRYTKDGRIVDSNESEPESIVVTTSELWMTDPEVRSTTAAPTVDNLDEYIRLANELGILSVTQWNRTCIGLMCQCLREYGCYHERSPLVLGLEGVVFLASLIDADGLCLEHIAQFACALPQPFRKETVAERLPVIYRDVFDELSKRRLSPKVLAQCKDDIEPVLKKAGKKGESFGAADHRSTPRLEWLVDFGCLAKKPMPLNGFDYTVVEDCGVFVDCLRKLRLDSHRLAARNAAVGFYRGSSRFRAIRERCAVLPISQSVAQAYRWVRPPIGSVPMGVLCLSACLLTKEAILPSDVEAYLVDLVRRDDRARTSGGHYQRDLENIWLDPRLVDEMSC